MNCNGIGRCPGESGRSHASVHSVRSWRAGLPRQRARTHGLRRVGREQLLDHERRHVALGHRQPDRARPRTLRAHRERGRDLRAVRDAAGREHRASGATASITSGHSTTERDLAGVPAGLGALRDDDVDADLLVLLRVPRAARERGDQHLVVVARLDDVLGRRAERVDEQRRRVLERDVELRAARWRRSSRAGGACSALLGQRRHVVLGEHLLDEVAVLLVIIASSWRSSSSALTPSGSSTTSPASRGRRRTACRRRARRSTSARSRARRA